MVIPLKPGKFYGGSLPRPRFLSGKLDEERVDPPLPILDPLLSWANEAHWSMGGLSFQRHRLQGRIEGSIKKLRVQSERSFKPKKFDSKIFESPEISESSEETIDVAPPVPVKKKRARKLMEEFERVAEEEGKGFGGEVAGEEDSVGVFSRTRGKTSGGGEVRRVSPRRMMS